MTVCEEIQIRAPWGFISGKTWGDKSGTPGLALHGIQDNASSFDFLVPHLPPGFFWVCIDLPGHGRSSHFSQGLPLVFIHYVYAAKFVIDHYGWDRLYLMGHSFGAQISTFLTALFCDKIVKIILLDALTNNIVPETNLVEFYRERFNEIDNLNKKMETASPPTYPNYQTALKRFKSGRLIAELTDGAFENLIQRTLYSAVDGLRFTNDPRLNFFLKIFLSLKQNYPVLKNIQCPLLLIIASETLEVFEVDPAPADSRPSKFVDHVRKVFPRFIVKVVTGNHCVHMNEPEKIGKLIGDFILETNPKL